MLTPIYTISHGDAESKEKKIINQNKGTFSWLSEYTIFLVIGLTLMFAAAQPIVRSGLDYFLNKYFENELSWNN